MEDFEELQSIWNQQVNPNAKITAAALAHKAERHIASLKTSQRWTIAILSILTAVLIGYFAWVGAHTINTFTIGLTIMISVILIRILLEWISLNKFRVIRPDLSLSEFSSKMKQFYKWRQRIHTLFLPIIYGAYIIGFTLLLPSFKENLSVGMYWYVVISGFGFLFGFAFYMIKLIRKETLILNKLELVSAE